MSEEIRLPLRARGQNQTYSDATSTLPCKEAHSRFSRKYGLASTLETHPDQDESSPAGLCLTFGLGRIVGNTTHSPQAPWNAGTGLVGRYKRGQTIFGPQ